jgi:Transposase
MKQQRHSVEQIIAKLRRAGVELAKGQKVSEECKILDITEQSDYRWRQKYGGMALAICPQAGTGSAASGWSWHSRWWFVHAVTSINCFLEVAEPRPFATQSVRRGQ